MISRLESKSLQTWRRAKIISVLRTRISSLKWRHFTVVGYALLTLGVIIYVADRLITASQTYLIAFEPIPEYVQLDGNYITLRRTGSTGGFIFNGYYGQNELLVQFHSGKKKRILLHPKFGDDNSSSIVITPDTIRNYGDLRYVVLE